MDPGIERKRTLIEWASALGLISLGFSVGLACGIWVIPHNVGEAIKRECEERLGMTKATLTEQCDKRIADAREAGQMAGCEKVEAGQ